MYITKTTAKERLIIGNAVDSQFDYVMRARRLLMKVLDDFFNDAEQKAICTQDAEDIGEINVTEIQYIKIYTADGTEIRIGDSQNFGEKYLLYSTILQENERKAEKAIDYIDVSIVNKPTFAYE